MKIVHLLSQTHLTGAEVYAVGLAEASVRRGHQVHIVSDKLHLQTKVPFVPRPLHSAKWLARWRQILFLRRWCKTEQIDILHAHSRAAVRVAWWATRGLPTALVSTIHGRQHSSLGKRLFDTYGERVLVVCEALKQQLIRDFKMRPQRLDVQPNPLPTLELVKTGGLRQSWLLVTRWSGPKGQRAIEFLSLVMPELLQQNPALNLDLYGATPEQGSPGQKILQDLWNAFPDRVRHLGFTDNLESHFKPYGLILGGGRVAMAAGKMGIPCFAFGEARCEGMLIPSRMKEAWFSNFGDMHPDLVDEKLPVDLAFHELKDFLNGGGPSTLDLQKISVEISERTDSDRRLNALMQVYQSARLLKAHPRPIPVLMYHKVVPKILTTPHRIFVTEETFRKHLSVFRLRGMTTLTFQDLLDFKEGRRPLADFPKKPLILTFDDGYRNNLTAAAPLLKEFGFRAVIYLLADSKLEANTWDEGAAPQIPLMTPQERVQLAGTGVFEIGSHGFRHGRLPLMTTSEARHELVESKAALEKEFGKPIVSFAFTYGDINDDSAGLAQEAGYAYAVNTDRGGVLLEESPWAVFRANVFPEDGVFGIWKKTSPWYRWRYFRKRGQ